MLAEKMNQRHVQPPRSLAEAMRQGMEERCAPVDPAAGLAVDTPEGAEPDGTGPFDLAPPADPADYVLALPRGVERDAELEAAARRWFHAAGLPQSLAAAITREYCRHVCAPPDATAGQRQHAATMAELRRDWGPDFDRKLARAQDVVASCQGGDALTAALIESGLGDNAWLLRMLAALGEARNQMNGDGR